MVSSVVLFGSGAALLSLVLIYQYARRELLKLHGVVSSQDKSLYLLKYSPPRITPYDITLIVGSIVWKYLPSPIGPALKLRPRKEQDGFELPLLAIQAPLTFTTQELVTFSKAIRSRDAASVQDETLFKNPFLLISLTTPLMLILLSHPECPIKPLGAVNTGNIFIFHKPELVRDSAGLLHAAEKRELMARVEMGGAKHYGQRRRRGFQFTVYVKVYFQDELVLTQELSFLQFLPKHYKPLYREQSNTQTKVETEAVQPAKSQGSIDLDLKAPLRWAASCRDYNPIHVSRLLAKAFGFPSVIAHGNYVVTLAVQQLVRDTPKLTPDAEVWHEDDAVNTARELCWKTTRPTKLEVSFLKPTILPASVNVHWSSSDKGAVTLVISKGDTARIRSKLSYI